MSYFEFIISRECLPYSKKLLRDKLSRLENHVSIHRKTSMFASKQCPLAPKHFKIRGKTFTVQGKTMKFTKVLSIEGFVLYGNKLLKIIKL